MPDVEETQDSGPDATVAFRPREPKGAIITPSLPADDVKVGSKLPIDDPTS